MSYPSIIAIIDAELDRLQEVLTLLQSSTEPVQHSRKQKIADVPVLPKPKKRVAPVVAAPEMLPEPAMPEQPHVKQVPTRSRRERKPRVLNKANSMPASALSGAVPGMPVYVSAEHVRRNQLLARETEKSAAVIAAAQSEAPTAEMVSRLWLQSHRSEALK